MPGYGGNSQDRRRARRAGARRTARGTSSRLSRDDILEIQALVAAASGASAEEQPVEAVEELGGKPNPGTKPDKRLKENKPAMQAPEEAALETVDAWQSSVAAADLARDIAAAYAKDRPDLEGLSAEIERVVRVEVRRVLSAAAGDLAWGPEEGFIDLLCDVNEALMASPATSYYLDAGCEDCYVPSPYAIDVSVNLDKVLICLGDDYLVAPISIGDDGEPVLSDRDAWLTVESGWVESNVSDGDEMSSAARLRFALRDLVLTADGATAPEIPAEHQPGERIPDRHPSPEAPPQTASRPAAAEGEVAWTATFVPEGVLTEDGRAFAPGALILPPEKGARELPLTLMAMIETTAEGGHDGAKVAGRIDQLWREGDDVKAAGVFSREEYGQQIARMVDSKELRGLSVDIAPLEWERTAASDWFDGDGAWIAQRDETGDWVPVAERSLEEAVELLFSDDLITVITKAVIGMATVCPFPAFGKASISLAASGGLLTYTAEGAFETVGEALVASAATAETAEQDFLVLGAEPPADDSLTAAAAGLAPLKPPAEWFADPQFDELTAMTITDDGYIYGHAWEWGTCHIAFEGCVTPPASRTEYAYFQLGELECDGGDRVTVGKITLDAPHAGQRLSRADAIRHYDHTGTVAAHVCFGEDEHGGWFAGAIHPELSEEKLRLLRAATVSGDWRGVNGNLELVALLAVNVPGFPVPRARALVAAGENGEEEVLSLTAAGIVLEELISPEDATEIADLAASVEAE